MEVVQVPVYAVVETKVVVISVLYSVEVEFTVPVLSVRLAVMVRVLVAFPNLEKTNVLVGSGVELTARVLVAVMVGVKHTVVVIGMALHARVVVESSAY
jgi:hypothetical protein